MPQLIPFYFVNQVSFAYLLLLVLIIIVSKYILPNYPQLFLTRVIVSEPGQINS